MSRQASRHRAGAVTRARQAAAKAARSATSSPLAANSSANRRGYRRVVFRAPWHTAAIVGHFLHFLDVQASMSAGFRCAIFHIY